MVCSALTISAAADYRRRRRAGAWRRGRTCPGCRCGTSRCCECAAVDRDLAGVDLAPDVHGEGAVDALGDTGADHHLGALAVLLGGLEDHADLAVDVVGHVAHDLQGAEHHGDMAVVAACVHEALVGGCVLDLGALGHGQRVDVRAQQDPPARAAVGAVGVRGGAAQRGDHAGLERALVGDVHGVELATDVAGGADLVQAGLRVLVEVPALADDVGLELGGDLPDGGRDLLRRALAVVRHDLLGLRLHHAELPSTCLHKRISCPNSSTPGRRRADRFSPIAMMCPHGLVMVFRCKKCRSVLSIVLLKMNNTIGEGDGWKRLIWLLCARPYWISMRRHGSHLAICGRNSMSSSPVGAHSSSVA